MVKFRNRYRSESNRMPLWDYSGNGWYFLTLVVQNRECLLGEVVKTTHEPEMSLSEFGKIVQEEWLKSFTMRYELFLDEFILMPNHLHAIIRLKKEGAPFSIPLGEPNGLPPGGPNGLPPGEPNGLPLGGPNGLPPGEPNGLPPGGPNGLVPLGEPNGLPPGEPNGRSAQGRVVRSKFFRKPKSISSFVAGFKSAVNSKIDDYIDAHQLNQPKYNRQNHFFQPNYYDHVIRNGGEYRRIKRYIINNPAKWFYSHFK